MSPYLIIYFCGLAGCCHAFMCVRAGFFFVSFFANYIGMQCTHIYIQLGICQIRHTQAMGIRLGYVCLGIQSHSSCWTPPVAKPSFRPVVAPSIPSGLTGTRILRLKQSPPHLDRSMCYVWPNKPIFFFFL